MKYYNWYGLEIRYVSGQIKTAKHLQSGKIYQISQTLFSIETKKALYVKLVQVNYNY